MIVRRMRADAGHREPKEDDKAGLKHIRKVSRHGCMGGGLACCGFVAKQCARVVSNSSSAW